MTIVLLVALAASIAVLAHRLATGGSAALTVLLTLGTLSLAVQAAAEAGMLIVHTPSIPVGLYWRHEVSAQALAVGQYVCLDAVGEPAPSVLRSGVEQGWLPAAWRSEPLVKRVAAVAGARIESTPKGVSVDGVLVPDSAPRASDKLGRTLPSPALPVTLLTGEVWLRSEHVDGFDSRYFGPVAVAALTCIAEPVWTW